MVPACEVALVVTVGANPLASSQTVVGKQDEVTATVVLNNLIYTA